MKISKKSLLKFATQSMITWAVLQGCITLFSIFNMKDLTIPQFRYLKSIDTERINSTTIIEKNSYAGFIGAKITAPIANKQVNKNPLIALFPFAVITQDQSITNEAILNFTGFDFNSTNPKGDQADIGQLKIIDNGLTNLASPYGNNLLKKVAFYKTSNNPLGLEKSNVYNINFRAERSPEWSGKGPASLKTVDGENTELCEKSLSKVKSLLAEKAKNKEASINFSENCSERELSLQEYNTFLNYAVNKNIAGIDNDARVFNTIIAINNKKIENKELQDILDSHRVVNSIIKLDPKNGKKYFRINQYSVNPILNPLLVVMLLLALRLLSQYKTFGTLAFLNDKFRQPNLSYYSLSKALIDNDVNPTKEDFSSQIKDSLIILIREMLFNTIDIDDVSKRCKEILEQDKKIKFTKDTLINPDNSEGIRENLGIYQSFIQFKFFNNQHKDFAKILDAEVNIIQNDDSYKNLDIDSKVNYIIKNIYNTSVRQMNNLK
jgi:hypothetical protein